MCCRQYKDHCYAENVSPECHGDAYQSFVERFDWENGDPSQEDIDNELEKMASNPIYGPDIALFFDKTALQSNWDNETTEWGRSLLMFGLPLADDGDGNRFTNDGDREQDQVK